METKNNSVIESVYDTVSQAVEEQGFSLPLAVWQTDSHISDFAHHAYSLEVNEYLEKTETPCDKETALKLLKKFARKTFHDFWISPIADYLPAVSEGTMKLNEKVYTHDTAIKYAKELMLTFSPKEMAKDFLYGVSHNAPEYRTALACYYYIKNLPEHCFEKKFVGQSPNQNGEMEDRFNDTHCAICGYQHELSSEPKMQFWHINMDMCSFYFTGRMGRSNLNTAIIYLEEYKKLPRPKHSITDYYHFLKIIDVIENTPDNMTSGKLRQELKKSGLVKMTLEQLEVFINTLGFLDILHPDDSHGMVRRHTCERDMLYPLSDRGYAEHPVNRWTRECGVDYDSIHELFDVY